LKEEAMKYERVIDGIAKYLDREIYPTMSDIQMLVARMAVARLINNKQALKDFLSDNPIMKTFAIMDSEGNVDIDALASDLKTQLTQIGKLKIDTKILGAYTFYPDDVDKLLATIKEGYNENY
jgi:hypothetical protein